MPQEELVMLLENATVDGSYKESDIFNRNDRNPKTLHLYGTFGGATAVLQGSTDGLTWTAVPNGSFTVATIMDVQLGIPFVRITLSGTTGPTDLSCSITW